jgi:hypothetical protein
MDMACRKSTESLSVDGAMTQSYFVREQRKEEAQEMNEGERCKACEQIIEPGAPAYESLHGGWMHATTWDCVEALKARVRDLEQPAAEVVQAAFEPFAILWHSQGLVIAREPLEKLRDALHLEGGLVK